MSPSAPPPEPAAAVRTVRVEATRLAGWTERFELRHGPVTLTGAPGGLLLDAADGARARLQASPIAARVVAARPANGAAPLADFIAAHLHPASFGIVLARRRAHAIGVVIADQLVTHRVGTHYVQARTKAGGWSQQRYARRRANQADQSVDSAVRDIADLLSPVRERIDLILTGGDRGILASIWADPALARLAGLCVPLELDVAEPRFAVLTGTLRQARMVSIELNAAAGQS